MRKALGLAVAGLGAVALTGAAAAASRESHTLNVPLPDGSIAHVEYVGNVAPRVTVSPAAVAAPFPSFGMFDRSAFEMQRQMDVMMQQLGAIARAPAASASRLNVASYGNAPAGSTSITVVTTSNGTTSCTRRTDVESLGPGKAPKVTSTQSGECGASAAATARPGNPA